MRIEKRSLPKYILLNILTLGIYGFIVSCKIGKEINALCKGDGEEPMTGYAGAWALGFITLGIYTVYWWYKQVNRLKLNANRYDLKVKESGVDTFLLRTIFEPILLPCTLLLIAATALIPALIAFAVSLIIPGLIPTVVGAVFGGAILLFSRELTAGAYMSGSFLFKNLNRFAGTDLSNARPFDPMAYQYAGVQTGEVNRNLTAAPQVVWEEPVRFMPPTGSLIGMSGFCAGRSFELTSNKEVVIGKDPRVCGIVLDPAYKEISRKHVSISYDGATDTYSVTDYSSNGTWANGQRLVQGAPTIQPRGTILKLAGDKNTFQLG